MRGTATEDASATRDGRWASLRALPWFAVLIPAAYVLNLWVETGVSVLAILRPLLVVAGLAALLTAILGITTRRPQMAGVIVLLGFGLLASRGPVYAGAIFIITVLGAAALFLWSRIRRERPSWRRAGE